MNVKVGKSYWYRSQKGVPCLSPWGRGDGCAVIVIDEVYGRYVCVRRGDGSGFGTTQVVLHENLGSMPPVERKYTQLSFKFD